MAQSVFCIQRRDIVRQHCWWRWRRRFWRRVGRGRACRRKPHTRVRVVDRWLLRSLGLLHGRRLPTERGLPVERRATGHLSKLRADEWLRVTQRKLIGPAHLCLARVRVRTHRWVEGRLVERRWCVAILRCFFMIRGIDQYLGTRRTISGKHLDGGCLLRSPYRRCTLLDVSSARTTRKPGS